MDEKVKTLLRFIKYTPPFTIVLVCILIISILYQEQEQDFKNQKQFIETEYIQTEKDNLYSNISTVYTYIKNEKLKAEKELKKDLSRRINIVHKIATNMYIKNKDTLSKDEIIKQIKNAIETMRFDEGRGYFSIHTMDGINILQPITRKYEGTSVLNRVDIKGVYTVQKAIRIAETKAEGFLSWYSLKPNDKSKEFKKIGIVKKFEPYDLIITTGIFIDDYEASLKKRVLEHLSLLEYKNEGFIAVLNYEGDIILHKSEKLLNHNVFKEKEFSHVKKFFQNLLNNGKTGDFFSYKPLIHLGEETEDLKMIYSKKFDDWNWIIATSFKLSDVNKTIEKRKLIIEKKYKEYKKDVLIYGFLFTLILLVISLFVARVIERKFLTYRENLENQISENIKQKESLVKTQQIANIGNWKLDLKTFKAFWSEEFIRIFGVENIDIKNFGPEYIKTLIFKEDVPCFENSLEKCINTGEQHNCIYRICRPDNEMRWINCIGEINKEKTFMMGTVQDITSSRKLELEKQEQSELLYQQSKMAAMGEMIGNIAHQWRQPLSTITTAATGAKLQKEMDCLSDSQLTSALEAINNSAQYLSQTIDDFRGFFNPKNSILNEFKIEDTIDKTLKLVDPQFNTKNIEFIKNIEDYKLLSVENDLVQILINILNNARDALLENKKDRRLIFINTYNIENDSYIEIIDNADGIKDNIIDRIFEPYFTTKAKDKGTGIGLYMSKELVKKRLNGIIKVSNSSYIYDDIKYIGAKFIIKIPFNQQY